jgi:hypothetical protein
MMVFASNRYGMPAQEIRSALDRTTSPAAVMTCKQRHRREQP